ncbi:hypothetical protein WJX84_001853 [Apatococcus fuscideae]|uniref:Pentatricopeptide repeat-containing protein n=1 Tax=Apatococcus fuscideae TaxID=2026836 RepID=A0AAW1SWK7_9CHLO
MSKKNNKTTQRNQHAFDLRREKEAIQKKNKAQTKHSKKSSPGKAVTKTKNKGFRIKKGVIIKGIRIKDAASKQKARELLAAEQALRVMEPASSSPEAADTFRSVITALCQTGHAQDAVCVLREMPDRCRSVKTAHDILRHCIDAKRLHLAAGLLDALEGMGLQWNHWTWYLATCLQEQALHNVAGSARPDLCEGLISSSWRDICSVLLLARSQASSDDITAAYQQLLWHLSGRGPPAQHPLDPARATPEPGIVGTAGQEAFERVVKRGDVGPAWTIIEVMRQVDLPVKAKFGLTLMSLLAAKEGDACVLETLLQDLLSSGAVVTPTTLEPLLKAYAHEGNAQMALDVLENVNGYWDGRTGYLYNVLIKALCDTGHSHRADLCYQTMQEHGFQPSIITFTLLFRSVGLRPVHWHQEVSGGGEPMYRGSLDAAVNSLESWVADLQAAGLTLDIQCTTALINAFGMTGQTERMLELLTAARRRDSGLPRLNVMAWGAAISNCVHEGPDGLDTALDLLTQMEADGVQPDSRIYVGLMHGCANQGRVEEARQLFAASQQLPPRTDASALYQHNALIKAECIAGNFDKALQTVADMPHMGVNPTHTTWHHITSRAADLRRSDILRQVRKLQREPLASRWDSFVANLLPEHAASSSQAATLPKGNFNDDSDDDDPVGGVPVC